MDLFEENYDIETSNDQLKKFISIVPIDPNARIYIPYPHLPQPTLPSAIDENFIQSEKDKKINLFTIEKENFVNLMFL